MATLIDIRRPVAGDIIDLILEDHRAMERLLRDLRDTSSDREALRQAVATVLVAHAEAEERVVYPKLRRRSAVGAHEAEHGYEEHAEGHEALLHLLELKGTDTQTFDDALEDLSNVVYHHLVEEELTILSPARKELGSRAQADLGEAFAQERHRLIEEDCGTLANVRRLVARSRRQGLLDDDAGDGGSGSGSG